jgi:hypothetical protein
MSLERLKAQFYVDPTTGLPHIHNHDVGEDEVVEVLESSGEDRAGREDSRIALGQTTAGRYLRVIYVPDPEPDSVFVQPMSYRERRSPHFAGVEGRNSNESKQVPGRMG